MHFFDENYIIAFGANLASNWERFVLELQLSKELKKQYIQCPICNLVQLRWKFNANIFFRDVMAPFSKQLNAAGDFWTLKSSDQKSEDNSKSSFIDNPYSGDIKGTYLIGNN